VVIGIVSYICSTHAFILVNNEYVLEY